MEPCGQVLLLLQEMVCLVLPQKLTIIGVKSASLNGSGAFEWD